MNDHKTEIKHRLSDPATVLEKLGLLETAKKNTQGYMIPCLWHGENDPSCSVRQHPGDGTLSVHCFGCGDGGDVFGLIGQVFGLSVNNQFSEIIEIAAGYAGVELSDKMIFHRDAPVRTAPPPPEYPPVEDLRALWRGCVSPQDDTQSREWFGKRGLAADALGGLCRVIPRDCVLPSWAIFRDDETGRYDWIMSGHRLIFPLYNSDGRIRSFKARALIDSKIKNVNPLGYSTAGLCFACENGQEMLTSGKKFKNIFFAEGEADFLAAIQSIGNDDYAVFGIYSGGWTIEHSKMMSYDECHVFFDDDIPGDKYMDKILASLNKIRRGD